MTCHPIAQIAQAEIAYRKKTGRPSPAASTVSRFFTDATPAEPIHAIRIRLPVEAVQGYRQGDRRDKSCQQLSYAGIIVVPTTGREKIRVAAGAFLKTAPIINWPVCPW